MSNRWFIALFVFLPCVVWTLFYQFHIAEFGQFKGVIQSDGKGYYAYLPAVWIEQDLSWNFFYKKENAEMLPYFDNRFLTDHNGRKVLKTYCGEAILLSPFFITGSLKAKISGNRCTGYEPYMQAMVHIAALFYLILGVFYWMKFLALFHLKRSAIQLSALAILFATNLFHYATAEVAMTHVYSFSMIACFMYASKQLLETARWRYFLVTAMLLAFIVLLRPVNLIVVLIVPFLAESEKIKTLITTRRIPLIVSSVLFVLICSIQPVLNYLQCGELFPWSYGEEGFYWTNPEVVNVLFSFRKGLFVYTPLFFLIVCALLLVWRTQKRIMLGTVIIACCAVYLISAWWSWYYGPGFGHRAFIDWFPILFIPLAFAMHQSTFIIGRILGIGIICCMVLNLIQTYQYQTGILEKEDMSAGGYKYVFLKCDPEFRNILAGEHELHFLPIERTLADTMMEFTGFNTAGINKFKNYPDVMVFDKEQLFSPVFRFTDKDHTLKRRTMLNAHLKIRSMDRDPCRKATLVLVITDPDGNRVLYKAMRFRDYPDDSQSTRDFFVEQLVQPIDTAGSKVEVYVYNPDSTTFALDEFSVKIQSFKREIH